MDASSNLNLSVGGDLQVESKQNRTSGSNHSFGISAGIGFGSGEGMSGDSLANSAQNLGSTNGEVSSANGGLNVANGRYMTKETVLTTLTAGNEANINVAGNTDIKGALIATLDENGNDLGNLNLTTDTLSFTDLNNRSFDTQTALSISTNVGISDAANSNDSSSNAPANPNDSGTSLSVNSSNVSISTSTQASGGNTLATIGQGTVIVNNEADSENLDAINRDTDNVTNELYNTDTGMSVDATIDHRLFTEDGREQIKKDFVDSYEFGEDIFNAAQTLNEDDALGLLNFWSALHNNAMGTQLKNDLLRNPENAHILEGLKSGDGDQYAVAIQELGALAQGKFGLELSDINLYDGDGTTANGLQDTLLTDVKGGVVVDETNDNYGDIFIDATDDVTKTDMIDTLGHEVLETQTLQLGDTNDDAQEALANAFGEQLADRVNQAAGGDLDSTGGSSFNSSLQSSNAVRAGTDIANTVGNAAVDNKRITRNQAEVLDNVRDIINGNLDLSAQEKVQAKAELDALACAAVKCSEHIPEDDPNHSVFAALQAQGESLNSDGVTLGSILGEETAGEFEHGLLDTFNDVLSQNDEALTRTGGAVQAVGGALGMFGGATLAVGGVLTCAPSVVGCALIPAGGAITVLSGQEVDAGIDTLFGTYQPTEGLATANSFTLETHEGDNNPLADATIGAGVLALESLTAKVGGKYLTKALDKYVDGKNVIYGSDSEAHLLLTSHGNAHSFERHGGDVTDEKLMQRALTGEAPDGHVKIDRRTGLPIIPPLSSAFHSDELLKQADQMARESDVFKNKLDNLQPGVTLITIKPEEIGDFGVDLGRGYKRISTSRLRPELQGAPEKVDNLRSIQGTWQKSAVTGKWETITIFPATGE